MFTASLWKRVPGQCSMDARLKPRRIKVNSLITSHLGLVKYKCIQTRTETPSCWDSSCPTTMPNGPFFGAVARLLIEHQGVVNCSLETMLVRTVIIIATLKLLATLSLRRDMQHRTASKSRQSVAPILQSYTFKDSMRSTPFYSLLDHVRCCCSLSSSHGRP